MVKVIRHGKKPNDETLYFECLNCGCQFTATKGESTYHDYGNQHDNGYTHDCPECGNTECPGNTKAIFDRFFRN